MAIVLYDLISLCPSIAWSSNTWKARLCLNFKGIPYRTEWIEWPQIKAVYQKHGIQATSRNPDGSPKYTMPVIYDPSTGTCVSDSFLIAEYLDKVYQTPLIFPYDTKGLQTPFEATYIEHSRPVIPFVIPDICTKLTPVSQAAYIPEREKALGKTMAELLPKGDDAIEQWKKYKDGLAEVDRWYSKIDGPFLMGITISWADFVVASLLIMLRTIWGANSPQWKDLTSWHNGRWGILVNQLDRLWYTTVV